MLQCYSLTLFAPNPFVTTYTYDELGNLLTQTDANNHTTTYQYDQLSRRIHRYLPNNSTGETFAYDSVGNLISHTDLGSTTYFVYDAWNRLVAKGGSSGPTEILFGYFPNGERKVMTNQLGNVAVATTYQYDALGHLVQKACPQGALSYQYGPDGHLSSIATANYAVHYAWNPRGQLAQLSDECDKGSTDLYSFVNYTYDAVGNLSGWTCGATPSQSGGSPGELHAACTYDERNRLRSLQWSRTGSGAPTPLAGFQYGVNACGQRTSADETLGGANRTVSYQYDHLRRLTQESIAGAAPSGTINYPDLDPVGNRKSRTTTGALGNRVSTATKTFDARDRLTGDDYDANGNTLRPAVDELSPSPTASDQFDWANRLVKRTVGDTTIDLSYDGDGNLVQKVVTEPGTGGGSRWTRYYYLVDDRNPTGYPQTLCVLSSTSDNETLVPQRQFYFGTALFLERIPVTDPTIFRYYGQDGHGNVRFLTDKSGTITDTYDYDAFGLLLNQKVLVGGVLQDVSADNQAAASVNEHRYCGEWFDADLALYFLRARYYNQQTGRFWTMDSYEGDNKDPLSLHKYAYAHNNPINRFDPSGNYSSTRQYWGYAVEDAIQDFYEEDNAGPKPILKSKRVFRKDSPTRWLFPDIYNPNTDPATWLEVKPLSISGVASGEAKRQLNMVALAGVPDFFWQPPLLVTIATGESFVCVNIGGVVYYQNEDLVEGELKLLISSGVAYSAKDLLKYVSGRAASAVVQGSLRPVLARAAVRIGIAAGADKGRAGIMWGISSLTTLLAL